MTEHGISNFLGGLLPTHGEAGDIFAFSWSDIEMTGTILLHLESEALELVDRLLGYRPHRSVALPYEIALRGLISSFRYGLISETEYLRQAVGYIKLIRNEDLARDSCLEYDETIYDYYWRTFEPYGSRAKERIATILGQEAELRHSLAAELWLRNVIALDTFSISEQLNPADYKVLTIIGYRQVLLEEGKDAADKSSLPFLLLQANEIEDTSFIR